MQRYTRTSVEFVHLHVFRAIEIRNGGTINDRQEHKCFLGIEGMLGFIDTDHFSSIVYNKPNGKFSMFMMPCDEQRH